MIKRATALALAASLVVGLPGGPSYSAFAQTAPVEAPLAVEVPQLPGVAAAPETPAQEWQDGLDQVVSYGSLSASAPSTLEAPVRASARGPLPGARPASDASGPGLRNSGVREGRALERNLERFGAEWAAGGRALHSASEEEAGADGYQSFRRLLASGGSSLDALDLSGALDGPAAAPSGRIVSRSQTRPLNAASETRSVRAPPSEKPKATAPIVRIPFSASFRYWASYYGSGAAAVVGLVALGVPFQAAPTHFLGPAVFAGLIALQVLRGKKNELQAKNRGGKELYTAADLEAVLANPANDKLAPAIRQVLSGLAGADQLAEYLRQKLGGSKAPVVGWYRPVPYNLSSWGDSPEAGWIGLGETVLTLQLKRDWKIVAGGMAHELGHLHFGDWSLFTLLDQFLKTMFAWAGVTGVVRRMTAERLLAGQEPLKDRYSIGVLGAVLWTAAKGAGLIHASWAWLSVFPAAWALMLAAALLKQAYMRSQELRADQFSAALTHPSWMAGYLLELRKIGIGKEKGRLEGILGSHPSTIHRIRALGYKDVEERADPPQDLSRFEDAWDYLDRYKAELESSRAALEEQLGLGATVELVFDGRELVFSVFNASSPLPAEHADLRVAGRDEIDDPVPGDEYFDSFRSDLRAARAEVEAKLGEGQSVRAAHSEDGFLLVVSGPGSAEAVKKIPPKPYGFPVVPSSR